MPNRTYAAAVVLICALGALVGFSASAYAANEKPPADWAPDAFPISFWDGPPDAFVTADRFKEIADAGFTHAMPRTSSGVSIEANKKILGYCQAAGIKAFLRDPRMPHGFGPNGEGKERLDAIVADYATHPAFAGYFIGDEPSAGAFPALKQTVDYLREKDSKHPAYLNLYPNYCPPGGLGAPNYEAYLEQFMTIVNPSILSYDHYHFLNQSDRPGFMANLAAVRATALKYDVPFWQIVLLINHFDYRSPTEAELRWEAMQTLAFGGKGLMWFTYWQPAKDWGQAIITLDGQRTEKYAIIQRVNRDVQAIGKHLLHATSLRTFEVGTPSDLTYTGGDQPIVVNSLNLTIGYFTAGASDRYVLVANRDYRQPVTTDVSINAGGSTIERLDKSTAAWTPVTAAIGDKGAQTVAVQLNAGDADLYRWSTGAKEPAPTPADAAVDELRTRETQ